MHLFELLNKTSHLYIFALTCTIICIFAEYKQFDIIEYKNFRISFDVIYFFALVGSTISWLILVKRALYWPITKIINRHKIHQLKKYWIREYNELSENEKDIINYCLFHKTLIFEAPLFDNEEYINSIYSLVIRKFGQNITWGGRFALHKDCYEILKEYTEKKSKKTR